MEGVVALSIFTPSRPRSRLALLACVPGIIAGVLVFATLVLLAVDGHPEGLLAAAAGAVVPVVLCGAWRLVPLAPSIRLAAGSPLAGDDVAAPESEYQPDLEAMPNPTGTRETPESGTTKATEPPDFYRVVETVDRLNARDGRLRDLWTAAQHSSSAARLAMDDASRAMRAAEETDDAYGAILNENENVYRYGRWPSLALFIALRRHDWRVNRALRKADSADQRARRLAGDRDRLVGAYIGAIQNSLLKSGIPFGQLPPIQAALRDLLQGESTGNAVDAWLRQHRESQRSPARPPTDASGGS